MFLILIYGGLHVGEEYSIIFFIIIFKINTYATDQYRDDPVEFL